MSTAAQITANIENAKHSTGPKTEAGKAASSQNGIRTGLFAANDFVRPHEENAYAALKAGLLRELAPVGLLETTLTDEIRRALWRLRRCGQVEANLVIRLEDPSGYVPDSMEVGHPHIEKIQRSVDRARSQAHRLLHKCTAELRRLRAERRQPRETPGSAPKQPATERTQPTPAAIPRCAPCPCHSGLKFKRCCGKSAPPVLHEALAA